MLKYYNIINTSNVLHSPNQTGVGSYQVWSETLRSPSQSVHPSTTQKRGEGGRRVAVDSEIAF